MKKKTTTRYMNECPTRPESDFWTKDTPDEKIAADLEAGGYTRDKAGDDFPRVLAAVRAMLEGEIDGLVLNGRTGCGKTTAAKAIAPHLLDAPTGVSARVRFDDDPPPEGFVPYNDGILVECSVQEEIAASVPDDDHPHAFLSSPRWNTLLDDMGAERTVVSYGNRVEPVADFIHRWDAEKGRGRLVITTNLDAPGIKKRYDDRALSRLVARCGWLAMTAPDHRLATIRRF